MLTIILTSLNNGCQQRVQIATEGYEQPNQEGNKQEKNEKDNGRLPSPLVHLLDDCFVTINKALNHLHVLGVGTMEDVDDVAYEERDHA